MKWLFSIWLLLSAVITSAQIADTNSVYTGFAAYPHKSDLKRIKTGKIYRGFANYSHLGEFGVGCAAVYQRWTQSFAVAPMVAVGVNRTLFSFSATLTRGEGQKLNSIGGDDWNVTGRSYKTFTIGFYMRPEEDIDLWLVPAIGCSFVTDVLQTPRGWVYGQPNYIPACRIDIRYNYLKSGLGYWMGFGNVEMFSMGITWKYKK